MAKYLSLRKRIAESNSFTQIYLNQKWNEQTVVC